MGSHVQGGVCLHATAHQRWGRFSAAVAAVRAIWTAGWVHVRTTVVLVGLNLPLVALALLRNLDGTDTGPLSLAYHAGTIVGWYLLPPLLLVPLLTLPLAGWRRVAAWMAAALSGGYVFFLVVDAVVFSLYRFHIDFFWLDFVVRDFRGLGIPSSLALLAGGGLATLVLLERVLYALARRLGRSRLAPASVLAMALVGLTVSQTIHVIAYEKNDLRITRSTPLLPFYLPLRSHSYAVRYGDMLPMVRAAAEVGDDGGSVLRYPLAPVRRDTTAGRRPNIVMILLESWRADSMNAAVTPRIAAFGRHGIVCREHFSSGNSTVAGIFGLLYGIQPTYWDAVKANSARIDNPVLVDVLRDDGYDLAVYARSQFQRHKIADTMFRGIPVQEDFAGRSADQWDRDMTDRMLAFLDDHAGGDKPFFLFAFYKASHFSYFTDADHEPFQPTANVAARVVTGRRERGPVMNAYRNSLYFDDEQVGRILDRLDAHGLMDDTIVIITSDHAEEFDDDGADCWGHGSNFTRWQTQVPLVMHLPGEAPREITARTSHLDVVPTLLHRYLGVSSDVAAYSDGLDLTAGPVPRQRPLIIASYVNHAVVVGDAVWAMVPLGTDHYTLDDIAAAPSRRDGDLVQRALVSASRFLGPQKLDDQAAAEPESDGTPPP